MFNDKKFYELFPKDVYEMCISISRQGFCLTLVGGAVRDFLKDGKLSHDLDFEIKHLFEYKEERWERMLKRLFENLSQEFSVDFEEKGLNIFACDMGEFSLEFSSPRIEVFEEGDLSHKNFSAKYISNLPYEKAYSRRDFTLNSMGIFFGVAGASDEFQIVDPFNGYDDLTNKKLVNIDDNFFKDPVRLLRTIRFKHKHKLTVDQSIVDNISKFNLSKISPFYIMTEFKKSNSLEFFKDLFEICESHNIELEAKLKELSFLKKIEKNSSLIEFSMENFFAWIGLHTSLNEDQKYNVFKFFGFSQKLGDKFIRVERTYSEFDKIDLKAKSDFFILLFSLDIPSSDHFKWPKYKGLWNEELKQFRPSSNHSAKKERVLFIENLTKKILAENIA